MKIGLVGLGKIGMLYDLKTPFYNSHLKSILYFNPSELHLIDSDPSKRLIVQQYYGEFNYTFGEHVSELPSDLDLLVLATPTTLHHSISSELKKWVKAKSILIEKPVGSSLAENCAILNNLNSISREVYVNYIRRTDPGISKFINKICNKTSYTGQIFIEIVFKGTLLNIGSHFIDLAFVILKKCGRDTRSVRYKITGSSYRIIGDTFEVDVHIDDHLQTENPYHLTVYSEDFTYSFLEGGLILRSTSKAGYKREIKNCGLNNYQLHVYRALLRDKLLDHDSGLNVKSIANTDDCIAVHNHIEGINNAS